MFTVIPQQTVPERSHQFFSSLGDRLIRKRLRLHHPVHTVYQYIGAIRKVLQSVYAHRGAFVYAAEDEPLVCDDSADELAVFRKHREDVRDQVGNLIVSYINAEMSENGSLDLQQVSPPELGLLTAVCSALTVLAVQPDGFKKFELGEKTELLHQECQQLQHGERLTGETSERAAVKWAFYPHRHEEEKRLRLKSQGRDWPPGFSCTLPSYQKAAAVALLHTCAIFFFTKRTGGGCRSKVEGVYVELRLDMFNLKSFACMREHYAPCNIIQSAYSYVQLLHSFSYKSHVEKI